MSSNAVTEGTLFSPTSDVAVNNDGSNTSALSLQSNQPSMQTSTVDVDFDAGVKTAVQFLTNAKVKFTPRNRKIAFLCDKGLTVEQISAAFKHIGEEVSANEINEIIASQKKTFLPPSHNYSSTNQQLVQASPRNPFSSEQIESNKVMYNQPVQTHTLYQSLPPPSLAQAQESAHRGSGYDWRDVVIALGATFAAGWSAVKLFTRYSPYEFRRKDDHFSSSQIYKNNANVTNNFKQRDSFNGAHANHLHSDRTKRLYHNKSSYEEAGKYASYAKQNVETSQQELQPSRVGNTLRVIPPLPATPLTSINNNNSNNDEHKDITEELKKLQEEKKSLEDKLKKEQEKSAKLAMSSSQAQKNQKILANKSANLIMELDELKEKYEKLLAEQKESEVEPKVSESLKEEEHNTDKNAKEEEKKEVIIAEDATITNSEGKEEKKEEEKKEEEEREEVVVTESSNGKTEEQQICDVSSGIEKEQIDVNENHNVEMESKEAQESHNNNKPEEEEVNSENIVKVETKCEELKAVDAEKEKAQECEEQVKLEIDR